MSRKATLMAALATAAVVTGMVVLPATGHDVKPTGTLAFTGKGSSRDQKMVDVRPKGISLGDQFLGAETLRQAGAPAGRMEVDCVVIDRTYAGQACSLTLILKDGQVTAQGAGVDKRIPGIGGTTPPTGDEFALTGGTGVYQGAAGTLRLKSGRTSDAVTLLFSP
jgi:hypothetical protein